MLKPDGSIDFVEELTNLVEQFMHQYEETRGALQNDLERGLVISYVLGVMRCNLEMIWDCLADAPVFGSLHPRVVFEECTGRQDPAARERCAAVVEALRQRGWLPPSAP